MPEQASIVGVVLGEVDVVGETHYERAVPLRAHYLLKEAAGGLLFEPKPVMHRVAGIHQQSHSQGKIALATERRNLGGRLVVIFDAELMFFQVVYEFVSLGHAKE